MSKRIPIHDNLAVEKAVDALALVLLRDYGAFDLSVTVKFAQPFEARNYHYFKEPE
jgi:hypothetical protein